MSSTHPDHQPEVSATILVPADRNGPPRSGNGEVVAEAAAAADLTAPVEVSLRRPPPLDEPMRVTEDAGTWTALAADGGTVLEARVADEEPEALPFPGVEAALAGAEHFLARTTPHPFPTCFVCGDARPDGMRVFPGPVPDGDGTVAAIWDAGEQVLGGAGRATAYPAGWAALDCVGAWALDFGERVMVLARTTARLARRPEPGRHVVSAVPVSRDGRKHRARTTLHTEDGMLVGAAEQLWIEIDPKNVGA